MKVLALGLDRTILDKNSALAQRARQYGDLVEKYTIVVPFSRSEKVILSDRVAAYGVPSKNKISGFWKIYQLAKKLIRQEKFDLLTAQDQYFLGWLAGRLARKFKLGWEIQVHGFEKFSGLRKIIAKRILCQADSVRVVSQRLKTKLVNEFKVSPNRITVIPIYVNVWHGLTKVARQDKKFVFLTVGRLVSIKNIALQIKALAEVVKDYPQAELWILGQGPLEESLRKLAGSLGIEEKIKFCGWVENLNHYYQTADVFLLTSQAEGWGLAVIMAASFGLPIIMTDVGCAREVIDNRAGLIIPRDDKRALITAMTLLIKEEKLRQSLGAGAKASVLNLPSLKETLALYKKSWEQALRK